MEVNRPVPKPRRRAVDEVDNHTIESRYVNVEIKKLPDDFNDLNLSNTEVKKPPVPAARKPIAYENYNLPSQHSVKATGAIKKIVIEEPNVTNTANVTPEIKELNEENLSKTPEPRTSVASASKILVHAITDTCTENLKKTQNKLDKKFTKISSNVKTRLSNINTFSLKRNKQEKNAQSAIETENQTDDRFNSISFSSPLANEEPFCYEIPKSLQSLNLSLNENSNSNSNHNDNLTRNTALTRSLHGKMDLAFSSSNIPDDSGKEHIYGKIKKRNDKLENIDGDVRWSNTATVSSDQYNNILIPSKSVSMDSFDQNDFSKYFNELDDSESVESEEPTYANDNYDFRKANEFHMDQRLLHAKSLTREILNEFDPLNERTIDEWVVNNSNHLNLLETLLGEETYGATSIDPDLISIASVPPSIPQRFDSLPHHEDTPTPENLPVVPPRTKHDSQKSLKHQSIIIHQNLKLPSSSQENLTDDSLMEDFFAKVNDDTNQSKAQVDLSYPKPSKTSWFIDDSENLVEPKPKPSNENSMASKTKGLFMQTVKIFSKANQLKSKPEAKVNFEFIPKPPYGDYSIQQRGTLFKLPSGVFEDMLKELSPRICELKDRMFTTYLDQDQKQQKEQINLCNITSIQCITKHKFSQESREIHVFELNVANPTSSQTKFQRVSYVYGIHTKNEKYLWMSRIFRSLTNVFPKLDFQRAGWCYMKKSINSQWIGAWLMLHKRRLYYYNEMESSFKQLDLKKARCISLKETAAEESFENLLVEKGPILLLDCPPITCYLIMSTPRETKIWSMLIKDESHKVGPSLKQQQLTKDNVPVIVDKLINFIYAHGSMSEGIYRKSGSSNNVQKLLALFSKDAFNVQITRNEYSEHDVSSTLKKFFRQLPESVMGKLDVNFLSVSEMNDKKEKIKAYRELLSKLGTIEYCTLKKILGHLNFIQNLREFNKMGIENLGMVWGPTLMPNDVMEYNHKESDLVADLISLYKNLFDLTSDELKKEAIMLTVLKKYHLSAENLSNSVKHSGDLKVWIFLDSNPEEAKSQDNKIQCNVSLSPTTKVIDVCKELAPKLNMGSHSVVMVEFLLEGELSRPLNHQELLLNVVLQWTKFTDEDRKNNYLEIRPIKKDFFTLKVQQTIKMPSLFSPQALLNFADRKTKSAKPFVIELSDGKLSIRKKEKIVDVIKEFDIKNIQVYVGIEKKREIHSNMRWGLTLIDKLDLLRSRSHPFLGHVICGNDKNDQILWFASLLYSEYGSNFFPDPEIIMQ